MIKCPRCRKSLEPDASQCEECGEVLEHPSTVGPDPFSSRSPGRASADGEPPVEDVLRSIFRPMRFTGPAAWWMAVCGVLAVVSTGFAFKTSEEFYIIAALSCGALVFAPFVLMILGYLMATAVLCRKELTWVVLGIVALGAVYLIGQSLAKANITLNFTAIGEILKNEHFTKSLMTGIIVVGSLAALYPLSVGLSRHLKNTREVSGYKAETDRELGLKLNENETAVKLRTLEMDREIALRRLDLEELQISNERLRIESRAEPVKLLADHTTASPPPLPHTTGSTPPPPPAAVVPPPPPAVPPILPTMIFSAGSAAPPAPVVVPPVAETIASAPTESMASVPPSVPPSPVEASDRVAACVACGGPSLFSGANTSDSLCDDHNPAFQSAFRRCMKCSTVSPIADFSGASRLCRACLGAHDRTTV